MLSIDFVGVLIILCAAVGAALFLLVLQWWCWIYYLPKRDVSLQRKRIRSQQLQASAAARRQEEEERQRAMMMQEVAPPPRVHKVAWTGSRLAEVVTAAPPSPTPLRYPSKKAKVHPSETASAAAAVAAADAGSGDGRLGEEKTVFGLWRSPFVLSQCAFGSVIGFGVVFVFFSILLQRDYYQLTDGLVLTCIILSPPLSGLSAPAFAPLAMPEAAEKGWLGWVDTANVPWYLAYLPFVHHPRAAVRLVALAVFAAALFIPIGALFLTYWLPSPRGIWRQHVIFFAAFYVLSITWVILPLGLLGYCIDTNYDRTMRAMTSVEANAGAPPGSLSKRRILMQRVLALPSC